MGVIIGVIIIDIISESYHNAIKVIGPISGAGLCFPGIKTSDMTGTILMANGPRIPNFCKKQLERNIPINILYKDSDVQHFAKCLLISFEVAKFDCTSARNISGTSQVCVKHVVGFKTIINH